MADEQCKNTMTNAWSARGVDTLQNARLILELEIAAEEDPLKIAVKKTKVGLMKMMYITRRRGHSVKDEENG